MGQLAKNFHNLFVGSMTVLCSAVSMAEEVKINAFFHGDTYAAGHIGYWIVEPREASIVLKPDPAKPSNLTGKWEKQAVIHSDGTTVKATVEVTKHMQSAVPTYTLTVTSSDSRSSDISLRTLSVHSLDQIPSTRVRKKILRFDDMSLEYWFDIGPIRDGNLP